MQLVIEGIRKVVVLVLLMELVLQLQSGKQYEPYIKALVGIMVVYSLISGIFGVVSGMEEGLLAPLEEFRWTGNWYFEFETQAEEEMNRVEEISESMEQKENSGQTTEASNALEVQVDVSKVSPITIEEIKIDKISKTGGLP